MYRYLLLILALSAAFSLSAQTADSLTATVKEVTISATRLETPALRSPVSHTTIDQTLIQNGRPLMTLQEGLSAAPGVYAVNADNFAQDLRISIRGFGARSSFGIRGIKLLVDGLPETTTDGQGQVDNIDPDMLRQMEVLRGPAAGLYGNASGGVIALYSAEAPQVPSISLQSAVGSYGLRQFRVRGGFTKGKTSMSLHTGHIRQNGYRDQSAMRSTILNGKITYRPNERNRFDLILNAADSPKADDAGALTLAEVTTNRRMARDRNVQYQAGESLSQYKAGITSRHDLPRGQLLQTHLFGLYRNFTTRQPVMASGITAFDRWFYGGGVAHTLPLPGHTRVRTQVEWESQRDDRQRYNNANGVIAAQTSDQVEGFDDLGAGIQVESTPFKRINLMGGLRYDLIHISLRDHFPSDGIDDTDIRYNNLNPMFGVNVQLATNWYSYVNYATAFETPTLNEMANPNGRSGFNPDLRPQQSVSMEAGIKSARPSGFVSDLAVFQINADNELVAYEIDTLPGRTFFRNAGATHRRGIEFSMNGPVYRHFRGVLSVSLNDFRYKIATDRSNDGKRLPGLPEQQGQLLLSYTPPKGFYASVQGLYTGRVYAEDANTVRIEPVTLLNTWCGWRKKWSGWSLDLYAGVQNLTDHAYFGNIRINAAAGRYYEPATGRAWYAGVRTAF